MISSGENKANYYVGMYAVTFTSLHCLTVDELINAEDGADASLSFKEFPNQHLQVGADYIRVVKEIDGKFLFKPARTTIAELISDLNNQG